MQTPWRNAAYWLVPNGLLSLLSYTAKDRRPRGDTAHHGLGPPTPIISQEIASRPCLQASLVGAFTQLRFPLL